MAALQEFATITAKGQTTVPKAIRQALGVASGDRIAFRVDESGVSVHRVEANEADPAMESFLTFLARDIERHPQAVQSLSPALRDRLSALTQGMEVDLDQDIEGAVDL